MTLQRPTKERLEDILIGVKENQDLTQEEIEWLVSEISAFNEQLSQVTKQRDEAKQYYGPAGLRAVSSFIKERDHWRERAEKAEELLNGK